jgi:hypothetical protein
MSHQITSKLTVSSVFTQEVAVLIDSGRSDGSYECIEATYKE